MNIQIRRATMEDYEAVNAIVKEGQDEHARQLPHIFREIECVMPFDYYKSLIQSKTEEVLVAQLGNEIVGFAVIERKESPPFDSLVPRTFCYINDFGVKESYQQKGIGKQLFQAFEEWARTHGASTMELNVWAFNQRAIRFYQSLGMEEISLRMSKALGDQTEITIKKPAEN